MNPKIPTDLRKTITTNSTVEKIWSSLTPIAQRDFVSWIESAKQLETRKWRIESLPSRLLAGKRRPCCYAVIPMKLYTYLSANPKVKAKWKTLSPTERRDFVSRINIGR